MLIELSEKRTNIMKELLLANTGTSNIGDQFTKIEDTLSEILKAQQVQNELQQKQTEQIQLQMQQHEQLQLQIQQQNVLLQEIITALTYDCTQL